MKRPTKSPLERCMARHTARLHLEAARTEHHRTHTHVELCSSRHLCVANVYSGHTSGCTPESMTVFVHGPDTKSRAATRYAKWHRKNAKPL